IGHSVRTLDECVAEAEKDITVTTNIMEARLLAGSETLFDEMKTRTGPDRIWDSKAFFQAKLEEQIQRNGKFNDTAYNLEPNIKESRGGLRDIQMIGWVAKRHFNADSLEELVNNGFLLEDEYQTLCDGQHLLWQLRCSLHYLAGRREDRLLFDYQRQLADEFGYKDNEDAPRNEAIEAFMQRYYRTVIKLEQLNEMLLQHFREAIIYGDEPGSPQIINERFQVSHGYIEIRRPDTFRKNPTALLELFVLLEENPDIQGVRASTIREIRQSLPLIDDAFRQSEEARQLFMRILSHSRGITHELRRMHRYGILAAYIPAFDSIVGRMQYDLFHAYTVDQHTLFVIRNMRRFSVPEFCHEFPLASGVFQHLKEPRLLYLAGLFHDIAKGRHGDHSELGAVDAYNFCRAHGLKEKQAKLVSWLVASHLIMSMTAQRRDLSDPDVIADFAEKVSTLEKLDYLYLLTISDIRATNPKQWNNWKDKLLSELYNKTASLLNRGLENQQSKLENIIAIQTSALRKLE
ncbi:MAG TPA: [protein-PII] uridylyltransferase, partial [Thiotrichales bacterium]|nr:[protein-PII] uridylyltransferase [Thiotrichales bacterium]